MRRRLSSFVMSELKDISPVGWYVGSYLLRFVEADSARDDNNDRRSLIWENTVLIKAASRGEAYDKIIAIAAENTRPYKGGRKAIDVHWTFEGVTEIIPVYEELADGSEILWSEYRQSPRRLRRRVRRREDFER
jgi:hypothetical protein